MNIPFSDCTFAPKVRRYNEKNFNYATLGECSYVVKADIEYATNKKPPHILIGKFCSLAENISFCAGLNHEYKNAVTTYPFDVDFVIENILESAEITHSAYIPKEKRYDNHHQIIIGNDVWIGRESSILGGVKIGSGAIIGANSVVAKDIPPYAIAVGNPARVIKYRFDAETVKKLMAVKWWNWDIKKIYENIPRLYDTENFLTEFYSETEKSEIEIDDKIKNTLAQGGKVYQFVADFDAENFLWKRIVIGFCLSNFKNSLLIIWTGENPAEKDLKKLGEVVKLFCNDAASHILTISTEKIFKPQILKLATHFVTTREMINLDCLDFLYDTNAKIISALDDEIFENETALKLYNNSAMTPPHIF
ncbi:MAG: CatB-related O-acetyltransferase [Selenomonadaceae bacterium]|nr:CatB-related O-acetyltransferase [Selenomonadaceae bacterium]